MRSKSTPSLLSFVFCVRLLLLILLLSGCAGKGPILIEGVTYQAPGGVPAGVGHITVAVSSFHDLRDRKPEVIGQRQIRDSISNDLVVSGTVADAVAQTIRKALSIRGIQSRTAPGWELTESTIKTEGVDILVGGEIRALWIDVVSRPFKVTYKAVVKLRVSAADVREKKILRTLNLNSTLEQEVVSYSDYTVQDMLSEALSSAVDQLLNDDELKKKIH